MRADITASNGTANVLAQRYGLTQQTVYKWKRREVFWGCSHTVDRLQTVLTRVQETLLVHLRRTLLLHLDDLLIITRSSFVPMYGAQA